MGTTMLGGTALCRKVQGCGTVFKLSPSPKAGRTIVYSFTSAGTGSIMAAVRGCTQARQSVWHSIQWRKTTKPSTSWSTAEEPPYSTDASFGFLG